MAEARLRVVEAESVFLQLLLPRGLLVGGRRIVGVDVPDQAQCAVGLEGAVEGLQD